MPVKIALIGNPNSGKTTMFNDLTGSAQYVGNWPGVTVEKKEGALKGHTDVTITDLPGIYSLSPYTPEEVVSRRYLLSEKPDMIINIVDGANIERNLYLTTQLTELGIPVMIVMNMMDIVRRHGDQIDLPALGRDLGCEIAETSAVKGEGTKEAIEKAIALLNKKKEEEKTPAVPRDHFSAPVERALSEIENMIRDLGVAEKSHSRWFAVKLFERDEKIKGQCALPPDAAEKIERITSECEKALDDDCESIITNERYAYITEVVKRNVYKRNPTRMTSSDKIDAVVTNRWLALPIFALVMFTVYYLSITGIGGIATDWVNTMLFGELIPPAVAGFLSSAGSPAWLSSLILDGMIGGVGAVLGFLPQMMVLFFFLGLLEDCGYMSRIAFIMDKTFHKIGLSGKSVIPILIGTGCGVPGIMASRTIENESDRRMTVITTTFIPCSAKLPVIALIAGSLFRGVSWVAPSCYFIGIATIVCSGAILKKTKTFSSAPTPFVMELPLYHLPVLKNVLFHTWDKVKSFVKKAGSVILIACGLIWFLSTFNYALAMVDAKESMLASIGGVIAPVFSPLGWGNWQSAVAALSGLAAKENVVGTLGVLYGHGAVAESGQEIWASMQSAFSPLSAYSFLVFNLLCAPCAAAMGAIWREMDNVRWTLFAIGYQTGLAYLVSLVIYQIGLFFAGYGFQPLTAVAMVLVVVFLMLLFRPQKRGAAWS